MNTTFPFRIKVQEKVLSVVYKVGCCKRCTEHKSQMPDETPVEYAHIFKSHVTTNSYIDKKRSTNGHHTTPQVVSQVAHVQAQMYEDPASIGQGDLVHSQDIFHTKSEFLNPEFTLDDEADTGDAESEYAYTNQTHCQRNLETSGDEDATLQDTYYFNVNNPVVTSTLKRTLEKPKRKQKTPIGETVSNGSANTEGNFIESDYDSTISLSTKVCTGNVYNILGDSIMTEDAYNVSTLKKKNNWQNNNYHSMKKTEQ